jgi:uncharacterized membrane protein
MDRNAQIETLDARLATLERRTADEAAAIRVELEELRGGQATATTPAPSTAVPARAPAPAASQRSWESPDLSWLTGPRGLAIAGGVVTLLGIIFIFALAASRGWIGPEVRCGIGGAVSALLVGVALLARHRFGQLVAAQAAAGAGIGGFYVTLYAASRGYHLLDNGLVWAAVVVVAALAVSLALAWGSELLATLGLVAVVVAPLAVEGELTAPGLGASVVAAAAALAVCDYRRWRVLGGLAYGLVLFQTIAFVLETDSDRTAATLLACLVFALALAAAASYQRRRETLDGFSSALVAVSLPFALLSIWKLVEGMTDRGTAFLGLAAAYGAVACALWLSKRMSPLVELLGALSLFAIALATATYLSNGGLVTAWTLEALALTAVAVRLGQRRYQAAAIAYFAAAVAHVFVFETPLNHLFTEREHPATHIAALLLVVAALAGAALLLRGREMLLQRLDLTAAGIAALLALYGASLALMEAAQRLGGAELHAKFQRGETLVSALWAIVALALLAAGLTRGIKELRYGGFGLLGLALAKLFIFDLSQLSSLARAASFLAVGLALLAGGFLVQRLAIRGALVPNGAVDDA